MTGSFTPLIPNSRVAPDDGAYGALEGGSGGHVSIELREHEVVVPTASGPKTLLDKVTCSLLPGEVTAVLGPSGAGKTSLFNAVSQRVDPSWIKGGEMLANGASAPWGAFRNWGTVAPQDDVLLAGMSPRELTYYSFLLRGGAPVAIERCDAVRETVEALELEKCADTRVSVISGGQRRRTSLALELVSRPAVLLCDEPTSGLDSASARLVVVRLAAVATKRRTTVAATIHQPAADLLHIFSNLLVLSSGAVVFAGSMERFNAHFGPELKMSPKRNPMDVVLDKVSEAPEDAKARWRAEGKKAPPPTTEGYLPAAGRPPRATLLAVLGKRTATNFIREQGLLQFRAAAAMALLISIVFWQESSSQSDGQDLLGALFLTIIFNAVFIAMTTLSVVPTEIPTLRREYYNGLYGVADFFWTRFAMVLFTNFIVCNLYASIFFFCTRQHLNGDHRVPCFGHFFLALYFLTIMVSMQNLAIGSIFPPAVAQLALAPTTIPFIIAAGFFFQKDDLTKNIQKVIYPLWYASPFRYTYAILTTSIFKYGNFDSCDPDAGDNCPFYDGNLVVPRSRAVTDYLDIDMNYALTYYYYVQAAFVVFFSMLAIAGITKVALRLP